MLNVLSRQPTFMLIMNHISTHKFSFARPIILNTGLSAGFFFEPRYMMIYALVPMVSFLNQMVRPCRSVYTLVTFFLIFTGLT